MFDVKSFQKASFTPREEEIEFSSLKQFGGSFVVRGLTAFEIAQCDESAQKGKLVSDLIQKLAGASGKEKAAALLEGVGISDDVPELLAKRYAHVVAGCVEPKLELSDVVRLADAFPIEFSQLANKILELTGKGQIADVKRRGSSKGPT